MADNLRSSASKELVLSTLYRCLLVKWKVAANQKVSRGSILAVYKKINPNFTAESDLIVLPKLKSDMGGLVKRLLVAEGDEVQPGQAVILLDVCEHKTIMKDMCAECGADLRREPGIPGNLKEPVSASVALVHNIPELRVSQEEAEVLAKKDKEVLLKSEKLVLVVDLDQTLIHTTTENVPADMKDIYHFQLYGQSCWYHTKFRPGWKAFLEDMKNYYELHIFTMGSRMYAHTIARMLDPTGELFSDRIRSRDESFDMFSKYRDLSALFPCDDSMVCIIDDREDIWDCVPNLITVKPYRFFAGTGDINAPPGSDQAFTHPSAIPSHESLADAKLKDDVNDENAEGGNEKAHSLGKVDNAVMKSESHRDSPIDTMAIESVAENSAVAKSVKSATKCTAVSEINHDIDGQDIGKKSGNECKPVNGDGAESKVFTKSSFAAKLEACDECETDSTVSGADALKGKSENSTSRSSEREYDVQITDKTRKEVVEPEGQANIATDESKGILGERSESQEGVGGGKDCMGMATSVPEHGVVEGSGHTTPNIVNEKQNEGESVAEMDVLDDDDDYLLYLEEILRRIHRRFYDILLRCKNAKSDARVENTPDLRCIVPELRRSVLKGTNVVFTGVIPTNCRHEESQAWKIATQFGADVTRHLMTKKNTAEKSLRTTHVVAERRGTEKACQASRLPHVKLVNPNWLWTCAERWEWVDERLFPVENGEECKTRRDQTPTSSRKGTPKWYLEGGGSASTYTSGSTSRLSSFGEWDGADSDCRFQETLNPLLSFSSGEVEAMDKEVEDLMRSSDGEDEDREILGSVSSSSGSTANGRNSVASEGSLRMETELDAVVEEDIIKGKAVNFSTIKQATKRHGVDLSDDVKTAAKKAKTDDDGGHGDDGDGQFSDPASSNDGSSGTSSGDDEDGDDNAMAAMLEAALYQS